MIVPVDRKILTYICVNKNMVEALLVWFGASCAGIGILICLVWYAQRRRRSVSRGEGEGVETGGGS